MLKRTLGGQAVSRRSLMRYFALTTLASVITSCGQDTNEQSSVKSGAQSDTSSLQKDSVEQTDIPESSSANVAEAVVTPRTSTNLPDMVEPTVTPGPQADLRPLQGYGFQAQLYNLGDDRSFVVDVTRDAGFNWLKQQILWKYTEPVVKGEYDWAELDKVVNAVNNGGLNIMLSVVEAPGWALGDRTHGPPSNPTDFKDFMKALASRYEGRVGAYELWNEANLAREWGYGRINAGEFVELMHNGYEGVKQGDANAVVVGGALTPAGDVDIPDQKIQAVDDLRYLRQMYEYKDGLVTQCMDAWGVHPGGYNNSPDQDIGSDRGAGWNGHASFYFKRFIQHREVMLEFGDEKPMWFTEFGWSTKNQDPGYGYGADNSEQDQADFIVNSFELVRKQHSYVTHMFIWNLNFQMIVGPEDEKYPFGILNVDGTPRPAFQAVKSIDKGLSPAG